VNYLGALDWRRGTNDTRRLLVFLAVAAILSGIGVGGRHWTLAVLLGAAMLTGLAQQTLP